jgi:hypothetical protein
VAEVWSSEGVNRLPMSWLNGRAMDFQCTSVRCVLTTGAVSLLYQHYRAATVTDCACDVMLIRRNFIIFGAVLAFRNLNERGVRRNSRRAVEKGKPWEKWETLHFERRKSVIKLAGSQASLVRLLIRAVWKRGLYDVYKHWFEAGAARFWVHGLSKREIHVRDV